MPPTRTTRSKTTTAASKKLDKKPAKKEAKTHRITSTHIYFHGGILSNWHPSRPFPGSPALQHTLPQLQDIPHPAETALSTRLIARFPFPRGEQWMMAMKAWLFERDACLESDPILSETQLQNLLTLLLHPSLTDPSTSSMLAHVCTYVTRDEVAALWETSLCCILREKMPRKQKALGRRVKGFEEDVWRRASVPVMVGGCVARAGVDSALREVYEGAEGRVFVEGSPRDRIWGVGLRWDSAAIEDETKWRGENRLGRCHSLAADIVGGESDDT